MRLQGFVAAVLVAGSVACATHGIAQLQVGASQEELAQIMGPPTGRYTMPDGSTRLEYATGPYGRMTWMVDLDAAGRVARAEQVLSEASFMTIGPGQSRDEVLRQIGRPGQRVGMRGDGQIWSWRYPTNDCLWYQVSFDVQGTVISAGYGPDPACDMNTGFRRR
jgi:hypothetical protein